MTEESSQLWPRWTLLLALAVLQAVVLLLVMMAAVGQDAFDFKGPLALQVDDAVDKIGHALGAGAFWRAVAIAVAIVAGLQAAMLLPVRRPAPVTTRVTAPAGRSLWSSILVCSACCALLWGGVLLALLDIPWLLGGFDWSDGDFAWLVLAAPLAGWAVATPLLIRFVRGGRREDRLGRIASMLMLGTVIEVIALIPLDVMVRRKTDCYCGRGTFFALLACGTVGVVSFGPAILLPLLARRRKRWYAGRCECCLYDMRGLPSADRCPECGAGWKPEPAATAP